MRMLVSIPCETVSTDAVSRAVKRFTRLLGGLLGPVTALLPDSLHGLREQVAVLIGVVTHWGAGVGKLVKAMR
jgi:hypothetical protein